MGVSRSWGQAAQNSSLESPFLWPWPPGPAEDCLPGCGLCPSWNRAGEPPVSMGRLEPWPGGRGERPALPPTRSELSGEVHAPDCKTSRLLLTCAHGGGGAAWAPCVWVVRRCDRHPGPGPSSVAPVATDSSLRGWFRVCGSLHRPSGSFRWVLLCELRVTGSPDPGARPRQHVARP